MRILHIIATVDRQAGGPSNSLRSILAAYPAIGCLGEVLTLDDPAAPFLHEMDGATRFTVHALGPVTSRFGYNRRLIPWLRANRHRFDGFVLHGLWQYLGWAVRRAIYPHKPYLVFTHGMLDPYFKRAFPLKHLKKVLYWLVNESWVLRNANRVLFTSDEESRQARQSFWPAHWKTSIVPYGANAPHGDPDALRRSFLNRFPALRNPDGSTRRFILFLGRIHTKKGCDLLLDAFASVAKREPDLNLVLAGPEGMGVPGVINPAAPDPGSLGLKARLIRLAASHDIGDRVHWTGMLYGDEKWGAFHACEVFSLPSHQENFGIAVAEALACGKPVLLSDQVNIWREIVADGAAFVGPDTFAGTLSTLEHWIALTPEQKITMGANAADCFHRRYDMQGNASGIIKIFCEALSTTPRIPTVLPKAEAKAL